MDIFGTTVTVLHEIYNITVFVKGVVDDVKSYGSDTDEIRQKLKHEFVFVDAFKSIFFEDVAASESYKRQPIMLQEDVKSILDNLKKVLAEYGMEAAKHGILTDDAGEGKDTADKTVDTTKKEVHNRVQKFVEKALLKAKDVKLKAIDWSLFEKAKIIKMLETYSEWTTRLRQSMTLMTEKMLLKGLKNFGEFAQSQQAKDLGLQDVARRQLLVRTTPDDNFTSLEGSIVKGSERTIAANVTVAKFQASWSPKPREVVIEHRMYDRALQQAIDSKDETKVQELKSPLRHLAWLLHNSPFPEDTDDDAVAAAKNPTLLTLRCIGYIDQPQEDQMQFIYEPPKMGLLQGKLSITTLHGLIMSTEPQVPVSEQHFLDLWQDFWSGSSAKRTVGLMQKPSLRNRFFLAHALALTVLNIHSSGWVHKNLWSHGIIVVPSANRSQQSGSQHLIPYVAGWGIARPSSAKATEMKPNHEFESNLYRHPKRQQQPLIKYTFIHDVYSLGVLLMEIGLWNTVINIFQSEIEWAARKRRAPRIDLVQVAWAETLKADVQREMGDVYAEAVDHCLMSTFGVDKDDANETNLAIRFTNLVVDAIRPGLSL
jgi:hypothetical protein